ncbi:MAG TPA: hybrid sensor histidine kinase/response regulator [Verrucomicrobiae bacterium]|nr:hybrid sensor histidine kinase/response regulator [Verrucomicrobiae bacterium]
MSDSHPQNLSEFSMMELFRAEVDHQTGLLIATLLEIERGEPPAARLETLMRAAHSLKGAARIVNLELLVRMAHAMEDFFVASQKGHLKPGRRETDILLRGIDVFIKVARGAEGDAGQNPEAVAFLNQLANLVRPAGEPDSNTTAGGFVAGEKPVVSGALDWPEANTSDGSSLPATAAPRVQPPDRVVRLTAENLNRLLALAGESLVESRWLRPFADSLQRLKQQHAEVARTLHSLRLSLHGVEGGDMLRSQFQDCHQAISQAQNFLAERVQELEAFDRRSAQLSHRLYLEALRTRMRPFSEGTRRFPRMVRDLARAVGKEIRLEITGEQTQVDRDILERLETPLAHLLRNAVDHGCELPEDRMRAGKPVESFIRLEARHSAGMLVVSVSDDGAGVDFERLRNVVAERKLAARSRAASFSEQELLEFLFLPGFTMKEQVTELSGRGVGLDIVQNMAKSVRGAVRLAAQPGRGLKIQLHLPLTLSVLRALLVEIAEEPYAIPLTQIARTTKLSRAEVETIDGRHYFLDGNQQVALLSAHEVLRRGDESFLPFEMPVLILGERNNRYGLVVDRFLGERELVVQPLDPRLGKIQDVSAAALMEDGLPVLILDIDELLRSMEHLATKRPGPAPATPGAAISRKQKRILAVDDSLTVREIERKLLSSRGYLADVAVDGLDGWDAVRTGDYDLVVTDVDMPRMDGIELAARIKSDPRLKSIPVMIVSYKDQEKDRLRGLEAGADYYLAKGAFHGESLLRAIADLIGEASQ